MWFPVSQELKYMQIVEGNNEENKTNIRCAYMLFGINLIKIKMAQLKNGVFQFHQFAIFFRENFRDCSLGK